MIIIAGDSWGYGEWLLDWATTTNTHRGLTEYLIKDGHTVCNISTPGGSNNDTLKSIKTALQVARATEQTIENIFVFQTEWCRDFVLDGVNLLEFTNSSETIFTALGYFNDGKKKNFSNVREFIISIVSHFYHRLSNLANEYNVKISIIGGCSDALCAPDILSQNYKINIVCQSLTSLILKGTEINDSPVLGLYYSIACQDWLRKQFPEDLQGLYNEFATAMRRSRDFKESEFFPDDSHPNRHGHKLLYDLLKEKNEI